MAVSRRGFLKTACATGVLGVGATAVQPASAEQVKRPWMGMLTDLSLCVGCRKCEYACNKANALPNDALEAYDDKSVFQQTRRTDADTFTVVNRFEREGQQPVFVKRQCMHCIEPACASACLVAAFKKSNEGPVIYDESLCIGCRYCMVACPFNVPAYEYSKPFTPRVTKCSMCYERIRDGEQPACACVCPEEAITFGPREKLLTLAHDKIRENPDRYVDHVYGETEAGGTNWLYLSPIPFGDLGFPTDIGDKPYPELAKSALAAVPLILTIWPMLLMGAYAINKSKGEGEAAPVAINEEGQS